MVAQLDIFTAAEFALLVDALEESAELSEARALQADANGYDITASCARSALEVKRSLIERVKASRAPAPASAAPFHTY
jgi:hypothetical protein